MSRLKPVVREELSAEEQKTWDDISKSRGGVHGPYGILMRMPELAKRMADLGDYFRHSGVLRAADRELSILAAAREIGSRYEWLRHEPLAREAGARKDAIEAIRLMSYGHLTTRELVLVEVVQTLFRVKMVPPTLYRKAIEELGEQQLIELVALAGFYCSIAFVLMAFDVALPEGSGAPF